MAFGLSGAQGRSQMRGGDVAVAYYDSLSRTFRAEDYFLSHLAQCDGHQGVCPDERTGGRNDVSVLTGKWVNGIMVIKYRRPLQTNEPVNDQAIPTNREVSVIAAIGPLNSRREANAHAINGVDINVKDIQINFSVLEDTCSSSIFDIIPESTLKPWPSRKIINENIISARIGPTGGKRGYTPLTGNSPFVIFCVNENLYNV